jgi:hypothetical protein
MTLQVGSKYKSKYGDIATIQMIDGVLKTVRYIVYPSNFNSRPYVDCCLFSEFKKIYDNEIAT